ncbi:MAG TPA: DUF6350 family protein [Mycobacteriales bacterium]
MTQAPERPRVAGRRDSRPARPPASRLALPRLRRDEGAWLPALLLALRTTVYGLIAVEVVVLLLWAAASRSGSSAADTVRLGLTFWAAAHHATVHVGAAEIGVVPLGLTALPFWLLHRGTRAVYAADNTIESLAFVPALATCYGVLVAVVALAARTAVIDPVPAEGFVGGAAVASLAALTAVARVRGLHPRIPAWLVTAARGVLRASAVLLGAGLLLAVVAVAVQHGRVGATQAALQPGASGVTGLLLLDVLALPHAAVWGASVLAGPGFGLGAHTSVSLAGSTLGAVPALPVLAALPATGAFPAYALLLLLVPFGAGALAARRVLPPRGGSAWRDDVPVALRAAAVGGVLWAALAWVTDGSAGPGRLSVAGPSPWQVGLAVFGELAVGLLAMAGVREVRRRRSADGGDDHRAPRQWPVLRRRDRAAGSR